MGKLAAELCLIRNLPNYLHSGFLFYLGECIAMKLKLTNNCEFIKIMLSSNYTHSQQTKQIILTKKLRQNATRFIEIIP